MTLCYNKALVLYFTSLIIIAFTACHNYGCSSCTSYNSQRNFYFSLNSFFISWDNSGYNKILIVGWCLCWIKLSGEYIPPDYWEVHATDLLTFVVVALVKDGHSEISVSASWQQQRHWGRHRHRRCKKFFCLSKP